MVITIPDNIVPVVLTDLEGSGLGGCKIVADLIRTAQAEELAVAKALANDNAGEMEKLSTTISPGFNRFRLMARLQQIEEAIKKDVGRQ